MAIPEDMQDLSVIIEREYVAMIKRLAQRRRSSVSRTARDILVFSLLNCSFEETPIAKKEQPADADPIAA